MTAANDLREDDLPQLAARGVSADEVCRQLGLLRRAAAYRRLERACAAGDGIRVLADSERAVALRAYEDACQAGRLLKFVPASGAATRMFKTLLTARDRAEGLRHHRVAARADTDAEARELLAFMEGFDRFAFVEDLKRAMRAEGLDAEALAARGEFAEIVHCLLTARGLDYAALPKGLVKFHGYPGESRTAFEAHLVEAVSYLRDRDGVCRLHFTVAPQHRERFRVLLDDARARYEPRYAARFEVSFSEQKPATDTVAIDADGHPFRTADGRLLFRPGGHGALIENLNDLGGDIVVIKNIDNVLPDHLTDEMVRWKRWLIGCLVELQRKVFEHVSTLSRASATAATSDAAFRFVREGLGLTLPTAVENARADERKACALAMLNRPIRVCGMVRNTGEPGGGPFWVRGSDGSVTLQIVESAEVDPQSPEQQTLFRSSTYFNPVDLVCGVRDWQGRPFDLRRYVDPDAVFIAEKSEGGRSLKALELPGLWNGGMAHWVTLFVEVPVATFCPVKSVIDLLRPEHQPATRDGSAETGT